LHGSGVREGLDPAVAKCGGGITVQESSGGGIAAQKGVEVRQREAACEQVRVRPWTELDLDVVAEVVVIGLT
jgi:hypothetical protein